MNWAALGATVGPAAKRCALSAALGVALCVAGTLREAHDSGVPLADGDLLAATLFGASIGCVAGLIFWHLRAFRERGGVYYYLSWGLSVGAAVGMVFFPSALKHREWVDWVVSIAAGMFAGFGLGAYVILMLRDRYKE